MAVEYAEAAFNGEWRRMAASDRGNLLYALADKIEENIDMMADLESQDSGKPLWFSRDVDIGLVIKCYRYYAGYADKIHGQTIPIAGPHFCYTRMEPVGVVG